MLSVYILDVVIKKSFQTLLSEYYIEEFHCEMLFVLLNHHHIDYRGRQIKLHHTYLHIIYHKLYKAYYTTQLIFANICVVYL